MKKHQNAILITAGTAAATGLLMYCAYKYFDSGSDDIDPTKIKYPNISSLTSLDRRIHELAEKFERDAAQLLRELIAFPEDHISSDPLCGTSNHEKLRLDFIMQRIISLGAVSNMSDIAFDDFGNLVWHVSDPQDPLPLNERKVIYLDARSDTHHAQNDHWHTRLGHGIDAYQGLIDPATVNDDALRAELGGFVPCRDRWPNTIFGRGASDQLQGIVSAVFATKILLETVSLDSLKGCVVIAIASVSGVENAGGSISNRFRRQSLAPWQIPDAVMLLQSTGDIEMGPCGLYIGQQGRCQIEVEIAGFGGNINNNINNNNNPNNNNKNDGKVNAQLSSLNALEHGSLIIAEAENQAKKAFKKRKFMGTGSRTVIFTKSDASLDPLVPSRFTFRFDRRTTQGETWMQTTKEVNQLKSVQRARAAGMQVNIYIPRYSSKSWRGVLADNDLDYPSWLTPPDNVAIVSAVESYKRVVSPNLNPHVRSKQENITKNPRISRWISPTDGVGYIFPKDHFRFKPASKNWVSNGISIFPPIFGIGAGYEQHAGKLGEFVPKEHLWVPISVAARFPSVFAAKGKKSQ